MVVKVKEEFEQNRHIRHVKKIDKSRKCILRRKKCEII